MLHLQHGNRPARLRRVLSLAMLCLASAAMAQAPLTEGPVARGLYNWIHTTGDAGLAFAFYQRVFGIHLARSTFAGPAPDAAPPPAIRTRAQAGSDELVWDLTNTHGSRFRSVFMEAGNLPFGLEISEFLDIPRADRPANPWDPGSSAIVFAVRDLDAIVYRLRAFGAPVVTTGGVPVMTPAGRTLLVRDPDGYLVQVVQASPEAIARAGDGNVITASIRLTVADISRSLVYYRDLLGFEFGGSRQAGAAELSVFGLQAGAMVETAAIIPGTEIEIVFTRFTLPADIDTPPYAYHWQLQDVGAPQMQLQVRGLDNLLAQTRAGGYAFLSVGGRPIQRPFGRFVFAIDPDGVFVEYVEPSPP